MDDGRLRTYGSRRGREPRKDAVLSAMLAQITICMILLALAYCLKLSGLPAFHAARAGAEGMLSEELNVGPLASMMERLELRMPVWLPGDAGEKQTAEDSTAEEGTEVSAPVPEETMPQPPDPALDEELAGLVEQYLPQGDEDDASATMAESDPVPAGAQPDTGEGGIPVPTTEPPGALADGFGQGGGITPVHFSALLGDKGRLTAPSGVMLSPFYLTARPILPVKLSTITSYFGYRIHPVTGKPDFHTGVDFAASEGTPIAAVLPGTVSEVGVSPFYGNFIVIRHNTGLETLYGHCSEILAPPGAVIRQYETIAKVGSTGMSTGNHVHLEFRVGGQQANPAWVYDEF